MPVMLHVSREQGSGVRRQVRKCGGGFCEGFGDIRFLSPCVQPAAKLFERFQAAVVPLDRERGKTKMLSS